VATTGKFLSKRCFKAQVEFPQNAHEIKTYALRKLGETLKATERNRGASAAFREFLDYASFLRRVDFLLTLQA
jgi:hypothetical protein